MAIATAGAAIALSSDPHLFWLWAAHAPPLARHVLYENGELSLALAGLAITTLGLATGWSAANRRDQRAS